MKNNKLSMDTIDKTLFIGMSLLFTFFGIISAVDCTSRESWSLVLVVLIVFPSSIYILGNAIEDHAQWRSR